MKRAGFLSAVCLLILGTSTISAQNRAVINPVSAQKAGLAIQWTSQVQVDPANAEISGVYLHVSNASSTTTFEVTYGKQREIISQFDYGPNGRMFGIDGAKEWADLRKEILKEGRNIDAKIEKFVTPKIVLYASTTDGVVQAIDGSTGKTIWATSVGNRKFFTTGPSANETFVTVINGSSIYCLNAETGKPLWNHVCRTAPGNGPAMNKDFAFVPLVNGFVEAFPLWDKTDPEEKRAQADYEKPANEKSADQIAKEQAIKKERISRYGRITQRVSKHMALNYYVSAGAAVTTPIVSDLTTSWPTLRGHYNVGYNSRDKVGKMIFRLKTNGPIVAEGAHFNKMLYVGSTDGFVYAVDERDGQMAWNFGTGEPISKTPIPVGESVYVITDDMGMYKIRMATGENDPDWPTRLGNIKSFVSASKDKIYCIDNLNRLVTIQQKSGAILSRTNAKDLDFRFYNLQTDRIFIGTKSGTIQCLREIGAVHPLIHAATAGETKKPDEQTKPDDGKGENKPNPFEEEKKKNPFEDDN